MNFKKTLCLLLAMVMVFAISFPTAIYADDEFVEEEYFEEYFVDEDFYVEEPFFEEYYDLEEQPYVDEEDVFVDEFISEDEYVDDETPEMIEENEDGEADEARAFELSDDDLFFAEGEPEITTQPVDQEVPDGQTVTFTVAANNATGYQWQVDRGDGKDFVNLKDSNTWHGTTTASFYFKAAASRAAYTYRVVVSNEKGSVASNSVNFTITAAPALPTIKTQPVDQEVPAGQTVTFTVEAENATGYQWQVNRGDGKGFVNLKDSNTWRGTTTASFYFKAAAARAAYTYRVVVSNENGSVESKPVTFTLSEAPVLPTITTQPADQEVPNGQTVTFTVAAENATGYQWQVDRGDGKGFVNLKDSSTWHGTTTESFYFKAAAARAAYTYRVVVSNENGSVESKPVTFTLSEAPVLPTITTQPANQEVPNGETVTFTVAANNATAYQWQVDRGDGKGFVNLKDSSTWHGTTTENFYFKAAAAREPYSYRVVVTNAGGSVESNPVKFTIGEAPVPPTITTQPASQNVFEGETVTFTVAAENATAYQWQVDRGDGKGFVNLKDSNTWHGTTTESFSFKAAAARAAYTYRVVVSNGSSTVNSDPVTFEITSTFTIDGVTYASINDTECKILSYSGTSASVVIPESFADTTEWYKDFKVVEVGEGAFEGNTTLASIDLPDTVRVIGKRAFAGCTSLSQMS